MRDPEYKKSYKSPYSFDSRNSKRVRKWISDAGLYLAPEIKGDISWHVGKNPDQVKLSTQILHQFDFENEIKSGLLFGFPETSAKAYAENKNRSEAEINKIMVGTGELIHKNDFLKDKYFTPYIFYNMPKNRVKEDSKIAKVWADTIRQDVPRLATWFENKSRPKN